MGGVLDRALGVHPALGLSALVWTGREGLRAMAVHPPGPAPVCVCPRVCVCVCEARPLPADFPDSRPAVEDLKYCLERTDQRQQLLVSLKAALETRLLHPGPAAGHCPPSGPRAAARRPGGCWGAVLCSSQRAGGFHFSLFAGGVGTAGFGLAAGWGTAPHTDCPERDRPGVTTGHLVEWRQGQLPAGHTGVLGTEAAVMTCTSPGQHVVPRCPHIVLALPSPPAFSPGCRRQHV